MNGQKTSELINQRMNKLETRVLKLENMIKGLNKSLLDVDGMLNTAN